MMFHCIQQRFQNCGTFRSDDLSYGDGRSASIRLYLPGVCDGIFTRYEKLISIHNSAL